MSDRTQSRAAVSHAVKKQARHEFDNWARSYDRSIVRHLLFDPAYRMFMEELHGWRRDMAEPFDLLDLGCGTGTWTAMVAGSPLPSRQIVGLDYSFSMAQVAHEKAQAVAAIASTTSDTALARAAEAELEAAIPKFINGDSEHLPFADGSFDVITCSNSFHHYPHQQAAIHEMRRVLRPGGRLMLIDGFRDNVIGWFVFDVIITTMESTPEAKVFHAPWSTMRNYFLEAGFKDIRQKKANIWTPIFITIGEA